MLRNLVLLRQMIGIYKCKCGYFGISLATNVASDEILLDIVAVDQGSDLFFWDPYNITCYLIHFIAISIDFQGVLTQLPLYPRTDVIK